MSYNGILNFYKEAGMTSQDVVNILRGVFQMRKIGHGGTLDPMVTGVLPILIGDATKVSQYILEEDKTYQGELVFGYATSTQDITGEKIEETDYIPGEEEVARVFQEFSGQLIDQLPPMVSAVRHQGKRLYEYERAGIEVERKTRKVHIYELKMLAYENDRVRFEVSCSKGTYVRTLVDDLARQMNSLASLSSLVRVSTGPFKIEDSVNLSQLRQAEDLTSYLLPLELALEALPSLHLPASNFEDLYHGRHLPATESLEGEFKLYCGDSFMGIGEMVTGKNKQELIKMKRRLIR